MNILEAYKRKNKNIIILITGINIEILNNIGSILSKDLSLPLIQINEIIKQDYFINDDNLDTSNLSEQLNKHKSVILVGFINPIKNIKVDFHFNIKFDSKIFMEKKIVNSKNIYNLYKENLKNLKINKFLKYQDQDKEGIINEIFNYLMEQITINIYAKNDDQTIFKDEKNNFNKKYEKKDDYKEEKKDDYKEEKKDDYKEEKKDENKDYLNEKIYNKKPKKPFKWDKDNQYVDIDKYTDEMHNIKIYDDNDNDLYKGMDDSSYSPEEKVYFVQDFFYKNYKGGRRSKDKNYIRGRRYMVE